MPLIGRWGVNTVKTLKLEKGGGCMTPTSYGGTDPGGVLVSYPENFLTGMKPGRLRFNTSANNTTEHASNLMACMVPF